MYHTCDVKSIRDQYVLCSFFSTPKIQTVLQNAVEQNTFKFKKI